MNAFNERELGHAESLQVLGAIQERGDLIVVPTLLVTEIAAAVARLDDDAARAMRYASTTATLPHLTLIAVTHGMASRAADLAANHRLRGADATYLAVAHRYATTLISRDQEQLSRGSRVAVCQTPEEVLLEFAG